jgi:hypothetical protein
MNKTYLLMKIESFDQSVDDRLSDQDFMADQADRFYIQDESDDVPVGIIARVDEDYGDMITPIKLDADVINDADVNNTYLNAELIFNVGTGSERKGRVVKRAKELLAN